MIKIDCCTRSIILLLVVIFICFQSVTIINAKNNPEQNQLTTTLDETDKLALETFSTTVNSMFNIVHQPNNKQNVISNVGNIISGLFNFVAQVVSHNKQTRDSYRAIDKQLQEILQQHLKRHERQEVTDATSEVEEFGEEQAGPIAHLTTNIHAMLATINSVVNNLYTLAQTHDNASTVSAQINELLEKIVQIAVETMKNEYLQGHTSEQDFQAYLESLEELQEKIKHTIVANALHLREEKKN